MMPRLARFTLLTSLLFVFGLLLATSVRAQGEAQAVILQYHHIGTTTPPVTSISADELREHLQYLQDEGFRVLPLEQVVSALQTGESLPERSAVLSFDDGYLSVFEQAYPLLQEFGYPFTVFVTAGLVTSNGSLYASWAQLREMGEHGATLANHTMTHPYLVDRGESPDEAAWLDWARSEIETAEARILAETGQSHKLLAYPYGEYDPALQALLRDLGYTGIGQHSGPINGSSDFTALPRFPASGIYASMNSLATKIQSLAFNVALISPLTPVTDALSPSAELQFSGSYRLDALNCFNNNQPMRIELLDAETLRYRVSTTVENTGRRFRYNCTAPGPQGRYYWYSVPFLNPQRADY